MKKKFISKVNSIFLHVFTAIKGVILVSTLLGILLFTLLALRSIFFFHPFSTVLYCISALVCAAINYIVE